LDIYNNKIKELPLCVYKMQELKTLNIANNDLSDIDPYLGNMVNLVRISIEGNPLRSLKPAIREAGCAQLKKYLQARMTDE
jgi:Leucine-rich repeat (LRR) protein